MNEYRESLRAPDTRQAWLGQRQQSIAEAQLAGAQALNTTHEIIAQLECARRMHRHDPFFSGSYHTRQTRKALKLAQRHAERLPAELQVFRNALAELQLQFHAEAGEFRPPRFTGYIAIGGIIVSSRTLKFIGAALERMRAIVDEAAGIQKTLEAMAAEVKNEQEALVRERRALIEGAQIFPLGD